MALFDNINSRYTRSMEDGGSYERDASIGGYDRKELRGLIKQAKSGTLTQRERERYEYLKNERGGRRRRGLLSGLGGAATILGGLAAANKLGQGGGEGGGLMDLIKGRLAEGKHFRAGKKDIQSMLEEEAKSDLPASGDSNPKGLEEVPLDVEDALDVEDENTFRIDDELSRNVDFKQVGQPTTNPRGDEVDFSDVLNEKTGEGDLFVMNEESDRFIREQLKKDQASLAASKLPPGGPIKSPPGHSVNRGVSVIDQILNRYN